MSCRSSCLSFLTDSRQWHVQRWQLLLHGSCPKLFCGKAYVGKLAMELPTLSLCSLMILLCSRAKSHSPPYHHRSQGRQLRPQLWERATLTSWTQIGRILRSWRTDVACRHQDYLQKGRTSSLKRGGFGDITDLKMLHLWF